MKLQINERLIYLYNNMKSVGTVTASITSLDERGSRIVMLQAPNMGSSNNEKIELDRKEFETYYEYSNEGCFTLYKMYKSWQDIAERHIQALALLEGK